eukprot:TRINITY_DN12083_c0_g1_i1.p1 TRINITY_DN12083_c0_g1~~TRINITY_DN12083_c0_g1_i1.p1  ORF type:complete len:478 (-),score=150.50 TRINITY_DN12083_c0_g1_i1:125-1558(-)
MSDVVQSLRDLYEKYGQGHVFKFWDELSSEDQSKLVADLQDVNVAEMDDYWKSSQSCTTVLNTEKMAPVADESVGRAESADADTLHQYEQLAFKAMSEGQVGVLLLAGGQGTRLGVPYPKGMYNIGLPSEKSLYQIQVERILKLQELASRLTGGSGKITMYIMTSEHTRVPTQDYFKKNNYFGADEEQIKIFEQRTIPAFDFEGKFIMSSKFGLARSPDGNGGLYWALRKQAVIEDLEKKDIRYLHVYCVDNVLVKVADPSFIGFCMHKGAEAGNKVVEKEAPNEAVGVVVDIEGKFQVVEYSEITQDQSERRDANGRLTFRAGNICNHFFTIDFLKNICSDFEAKLPHHIAKKKVPYVDVKTGEHFKPEKPNGIKLEKFVFDVFQFTNNFVVWECTRGSEFSPLKNADGTKSDNPTTSRQAVYKLHRGYLEKAGAKLTGNEDDAVEISPLVSYSGEGLESYAGKELKTPIHLQPSV